MKYNAHKRKKYENVWRILKAFLLYLAYVAGPKEWISQNFGVYTEGFIDCFVLVISAFVVYLYLLEENRKTKYL